MGREATSDGNFTTSLKDLGFVDDKPLLPSKYEHIQNRIDRLVDNAG